MSLSKEGLYNQGCQERRQGQYNQACRLFKESAALGYGRAHWELAKAYEYGGLGLSMNREEAICHAREGAQCGYMACEVLLTFLDDEHRMGLLIDKAEEIRKCTLAHLLFISRFTHPLLQDKPQWQDNPTDPWLLYYFAVTRRRYFRKRGEEIPFLQAAAKAGLAEAQCALHQFGGDSEDLAESTDYTVEAAKQRHCNACQKMCLYPEYFRPSPALFFESLGEFGRPETGHIQRLIMEMVDEKPSDPDEEVLAALENLFALYQKNTVLSTEWWRETVVRVGGHPKGQLHATCKMISQLCREACKKAVVTWILVCPVKQKDIIRYIGKMLLAEPWLWWDDHFIEPLIKAKIQ